MNVCVTALHQGDAICNFTIGERVDLVLCSSVTIMNEQQRDKRDKSCEVSQASCFLLEQESLYFTVSDPSCKWRSVHTRGQYLSHENKSP